MESKREAEEVRREVDITPLYQSVFSQKGAPRLGRDETGWPVRPLYFWRLGGDFREVQSPPASCRFARPLRRRSDYG